MSACQSGAISAFVGARPNRGWSTEAATLQKFSPALTTQWSGFDAGAGAGGVAVGGAGAGGGTVVVVGGAVVVVGGAVVVVGGAVVVVVDGAVVVDGGVVVVVGWIVTGGIAEAGGPAVVGGGAVVVVIRNGVVVELSPPTTWAGGADEEPAPELAIGAPPPHAVTEIASAPAQSNHRQLRFTGGERSCVSRYLAKISKNSRSPVLPTLAGPPEGLLML
jgi:hypothetical protein